jgi:hypothetical protein
VPFGRVVHSFLELLYDFAVKLRVQDEQGTGSTKPRRPLVSLVDDGVSMPILDGRMRGIRQSVNVISTREKRHQSVVQSTHEAALEVVNLADLRRREREVS